MIEHADFLDQPQRRIKRQQINQRTQAHPFDGARNGAEIDARHWHHVQRRGVVLGNVQAVNPGGVSGFGETEALVE